MAARLADIAGKIWNAPNTAVGLVYGSLGLAVGWAAHAAGLQARRPRVRWRDNAVQFTDNPFGGLGAITLGNSVTWIGDPYDPEDACWHDEGRPRLENGHSYPDHERQHTLQGQLLGPAYLVSNIAGGLLALILDRHPRTGRPYWHGPHNWNERGPQANPPRPWA